MPRHRSPRREPDAWLVELARSLEALLDADGDRSPQVSAILNNAALAETMRGRPIRAMRLCLTNIEWQLRRDPATADSRIIGSLINVARLSSSTFCSASEESQIALLKDMARRGSVDPVLWARAIPALQHVPTDAVRLQPRDVDGLEQVLAMRRVRGLLRAKDYDAVLRNLVTDQRRFPTIGHNFLEAALIACARLGRFDMLTDLGVEGLTRSGGFAQLVIADRLWEDQQTKCPFPYVLPVLERADGTLAVRLEKRDETWAMSAMFLTKHMLGSERLSKFVSDGLVEQSRTVANALGDAFLEAFFVSRTKGREPVQPPHQGLEVERAWKPVFERLTPAMPAG